MHKCRESLPPTYQHQLRSEAHQGQTAEACGKAAADRRGGIRCPSHRVASRHFRKRKQRIGIMGKQILTNSSGENFRFHKRKSTLFNGEKCENLIMTVFCNKKLEIIIRGICHFPLLLRTTEKNKKRGLTNKKATSGSFCSS